MADSSLQRRNIDKWRKSMRKGTGAYEEDGENGAGWNAPLTSANGLSVSSLARALKKIFSTSSSAAASLYAASAKRDVPAMVTRRALLPAPPLKTRAALELLPSPSDLLGFAMPPYRGPFGDFFPFFPAGEFGGVLGTDAMAGSFSLFDLERSGEEAREEALDDMIDVGFEGERW
ncbi:hypothetical protein SCHPADRAFT_885382 [Schizopora paradoxa]|uniref:Uncharacterized protein n=1 Tax=Schizopora paradoxa TaxID=27342 RepID=A0A0H2S5K1_9AGAM|nr:hypothetical protein SCHPADRAFT_885382 [Schizopora paradoxa]